MWCMCFRPPAERTETIVEEPSPKDSDKSESITTAEPIGPSARNQAVSASGNAQPSIVSISRDTPPGRVSYIRTTSGSASSAIGPLCSPEELFTGLAHLEFESAGSRFRVFRGTWHESVVAVKVGLTDDPDQHHAACREARLTREVSAPFIIQSFDVRCALITSEFIQALQQPPSAPSAPEHGSTAHGSGQGSQRSSDTSSKSKSATSFNSEQGFGDPLSLGAPGQARRARGSGLLGTSFFQPREILLAMDVKPGNYCTVVVQSLADRGCLKRPIDRGVFRATSQWDRRAGHRALLRTAREIAQSIEHLHALGIVVGNLHTSNVLLQSSRNDRRGFVAQVTMGLCLPSPMTGRSMTIQAAAAVAARGVAGYLAPEQLPPNSTTSKSSDVYALGIIIREMATGSKPRSARTSSVGPADAAEGSLSASTASAVSTSRPTSRGSPRACETPSPEPPAWPAELTPDYAAALTAQGEEDPAMEALRKLYFSCVAADPASRPSAKQVVQTLVEIEVDMRRVMMQQQQQQQQQQQLLHQVSLIRGGCLPPGPSAGEASTSGTSAFARGSRTAGTGPLSVVPSMPSNLSRGTPSLPASVLDSSIHSSDLLHDTPAYRRTGESDISGVPSAYATPLASCSTAFAFDTTPDIHGDARSAPTSPPVYHSGSIPSGGAFPRGSNGSRRSVRRVRTTPGITISRTGSFVHEVGPASPARASPLGARPVSPGALARGSRTVGPSGAAEPMAGLAPSEEVVRAEDVSLAQIWAGDPSGSP